MKKALKTLVIFISLICAVSFFSTNTSTAKTSASLEITNEKSDLIKIVRVQENGTFYLYIYTCDNIFVTKIEDL